MPPPAWMAGTHDGPVDAVRRHVGMHSQSVRADEEPREHGDRSRRMTPQNASHVRRVVARSLRTDPRDVTNGTSTMVAGDLSDQDNSISDIRTARHEPASRGELEVPVCRSW